MRPIWNRLAKQLFALAIAAVAATLVVARVRDAEAARRDQADVALWDKIPSGIRFHAPSPAKARPPVSPARASRAPAA